jgi:hypothetical protein
MNEYFIIKQEAIYEAFYTVSVFDMLHDRVLRNTIGN